MTALLETDNLTKLYGVVIGVNDMSIRLEPGVHGLLGPNGAGKSTFLKLITAQLKPSEGRVRVLGEEPWNNPSLFERIGFCPEYDAFYWFMSAFDFVRTLAEVGGMDRTTAHQRSEEVLELCGATEFMHRPISTYSKGMRQRTKVAQALVHDPEFLILDEPMSGTDPVGRHELTDLVCRLGDSGKSILVASHVLHEVQSMTDQFLLIFGGRVLASGHVREIRAMMSDYPHRISLTCSGAGLRQFAGRMLGEMPVTGVELDEERGTLQIATRDPDQFYGALPTLALDSGVSIREMDSEDDNLEAVFHYLVGVR